MRCQKLEGKRERRSTSLMMGASPLALLGRTLQSTGRMRTVIEPAGSAAEEENAFLR